MALYEHFDKLSFACNVVKLYKVNEFYFYFTFDKFDLSAYTSVALTDADSELFTAIASSIQTLEQ